MKRYATSHVCFFIVGWCLSCLSPLAGIGQNNTTSFCDTIPFELVKNKIIVPVTLNGQTKRFLFDTGANTTIDSSLQAENRYPVIRKLNIRDIVGNSGTTDLVKLSGLELGLIRFAELSAAVVNLKNKDFMTCFNLDGIIGPEVFTGNCVVHIDMRKKHLVVTTDIKNIGLQDPYQTPITFNGLPFFNLWLGQVKIAANFDTGMDDLLQLGKRTTQAALKKGNIHITNQTKGIEGVGLLGYNSVVKKQLASLPPLQLGQYAITGCSTILAGKNNTNYVGAQLCHYGTVTLDFIHLQFYFVAYSPSQMYQECLTCGFGIEPGPNGGYIANSVWPGSAAAKAGLKNGSLLVKFGQWDLTRRSKALDCALILYDGPKESVSVTFKDENGMEKTVLLSM